MVLCSYADSGVVINIVDEETVVVDVALDVEFVRTLD